MDSTKRPRRARCDQPKRIGPELKECGSRRVAGAQAFRASDRVYLVLWWLDATSPWPREEENTDLACPKWPEREHIMA